MKTLLTTCSIILFANIVGKDLLPTIFRNFYVFWGTNIGLVVLLSLGFAKSLTIYFHTKNKTIKTFSNSAWFLLLFLCVLILPLTVHHTMDTINLPSDHLLPIQKTSSPETEENRKCIAKFLFFQYGIKIPYRLDSGNFTVFQPTQEEKREYETKLVKQEEITELANNLSAMAWSSLKLAVIQSILFFIVFVGTIIYEQKQENKKSSRVAQSE